MKAAASFARGRMRFQFAQPPAGDLHRSRGCRLRPRMAGWISTFCLYVYYQGTDQYKYPSPYYDAENGPS